MIHSQLSLLTFAELGWRKQPTEQLRMRIEKGAELPEPLDNWDEPTLILHENLHALSETDASFCVSRLAGVRKSRHPRIQLLPCHDLIKTQMYRAKCLADKYRPAHLPLPTCFGAMMQLKHRDGIEAWMWWIHDFEKSRLMVCRAAQERRTGCVTEVHCLLREAIQEAMRNELREVVVWDPPEDIWSAALLMAQDDTFGPSVQVYREEIPGVTPLIRWPFGMPTDGDWLERQSYCWC